MEHTPSVTQAEAATARFEKLQAGKEKLAAVVAAALARAEGMAPDQRAAALKRIEALFDDPDAEQVEADVRSLRGLVLEVADRDANFGDQLTASRTLSEVDAVAGAGYPEAADVLVELSRRRPAQRTAALTLLLKHDPEAAAREMLADRQAAELALQPPMADFNRRFRGCCAGHEA